MKNGDLSHTTLSEIKEAILPSARESFGDARSLVSLQRRSRDANESPGINIARKHGRAAVALCKYLNIPVDDSVLKALAAPRLHRLMIQRLNIMDHDFVDFTDEVAGADAVRALRSGSLTLSTHPGHERERVWCQLCKDDRETIILTMACRLGMRRGAITHLRISSVVPDLQPGIQGPWIVGNKIAGWDKGRKWNEWDLRLAPGLREKLQSYLNETWRPKYEQWTHAGNDRQAKLKNGYLFPTATENWQLHDRSVYTGTVAEVIRRALNRAGIKGPRAHAHACRKGFSTDLLRANNPGHVVAKVLHHKNEHTTFAHYDQRTGAEVLANLRMPNHWGDTVEPASAGDHDGTETDQVSVAVANALQNEMEMNETMRNQLSILMATLTPEQRQSFEERCRQQGVSADTPMPE